MVIKQLLLTSWAQRGSIFLKTQTLTGYSPVFTGMIPKVPGIFQNGTFLLCSMTSNILLLKLLLLTLVSDKCRSTIRVRVANKVSNLGQWERVVLLHSSDVIAKNQLARKYSQKCVSRDYSCFDNHRR